jgi:hypothetical protein
MDETREILYQRQIRKERGEYDDDRDSLEDIVMAKARAVRVFYIALINEGFSDQDALLIVSNISV